MYISSEAVRLARDASCYLRACALLVKLLDRLEMSVVIWGNVHMASEAVKQVCESYTVFFKVLNIYLKYILIFGAWASKCLIYKFIIAPFVVIIVEFDLIFVRIKENVPLLGKN